MGMLRTGRVVEDEVQGEPLKDGSDSEGVDHGRGELVHRAGGGGR